MKHDVELQYTSKIASPHSLSLTWHGKALCKSYQPSQEQSTWCCLIMCSPCCTSPNWSSRIAETISWTNCSWPPSQPRDLMTLSCWYKESCWSTSGPAGINCLTGRGVHWLDQILWLPGPSPGQICNTEASWAYCRTKDWLQLGLSVHFAASGFGTQVDKEIGSM